MESRNGSEQAHDKDDLNTTQFKQSLLMQITKMLTKTKQADQLQEDEKIPE